MSRGREVVPRGFEALPTTPPPPNLTTDRTMTRTLLVLCLWLGIAVPAIAQKIAVTGGKTDLANVVVSARLPLGAASIPNTVALPDGSHVPAQVAAGSMPGEKDAAQYLVFVLPKLKAGETVDRHPDDAELHQGPAAVQVRRRERQTDGAAVRQAAGAAILQPAARSEGSLLHLQAVPQRLRPGDRQDDAHELVGQDQQGRSVSAPSRAVLRLQQNQLRRQANRRHLARHRQRLQRSTTRDWRTEAGEVFGREQQL